MPSSGPSPSAAPTSIGHRGGVGRIPVVDVGPCVDGGRWSARTGVGEAVPITATVFREGHDAVGATAVLTGPDGAVHAAARMRAVAPGTDRWRADLVPDRVGDWTLRVEGWSDPYGTWEHAAVLKVAAEVDVDLMLREGELVLRRALAEVERSAADRALLEDAIAGVIDTERPAQARLAAATSPEVRLVLDRTPLRDMVTASPDLPLRVHRPLARAGSWYEIFPRSEGAQRSPDGTWRSGTLRTAAESLPRIAGMGFDVVYLTPIHPIGATNRKGRNNTLHTEPGDPGSPYATGSADGGHDAIHPDLGTLEDFDAFVGRARQLGLEVAMDLALQCSPDHPWVTSHPEWFTTQADGTIAFAENPPKKYQDIYPLNFDNDPAGIYAEVLRVVRHWVDHGVTVFRVDNPHTKPVEFWEWLIATVSADAAAAGRPDVVFLSEAFTRPAMMHTLAKIGFHQSYTYFTWRTTKEELTEYLTEVTTGGTEGSADFLVPNFWPTTHDILTPQMQFGGPAVFALRAILAATAAPSWGVYTGYELVENVARPGAEEQIDNEKYEYKDRDFDGALAAGTSLAPLLTRLNEIRRDHPALRQLRGLTVHPTDDDEILCYSRRLPAHLAPDGREDTVIVVLNLDPHGTRETMIHLDLAALGFGPQDSFGVHDLLSGESYHWGDNAYVRLDPGVRTAHVLHVRRV